MDSGCQSILIGWTVFRALHYASRAEEVASAEVFRDCSILIGWIYYVIAMLSRFRRFSREVIV